MSSVDLISLSLSLSLSIHSLASLKHKNTRNEGDKSRCLPSLEGTGSFPAGVAGASAIANGNALTLLAIIARV